jgi:metal-responsive CopG/Arc/MetJ family transcriptional regulator
MEKAILQEIDRKLPFYRYSTRTEFIRDAIRSKLSELEKDELLKEVNHLYGVSKKKTTDRQLHAAGEKAFRELEKQVK